MFCPKCGYPLFCPCKNCQESDRQFTPDGFKPYVWLSGTGTDTDGNVIICAKCGHAAHVDWWEEMEWKGLQLLKRFYSSYRDYPYNILRRQINESAIPGVGH